MFERAHTTETVIAILKAVNGEVEYKAIEAATGISLEKLRGPIAGARKVLERDHNIVFTAVRGFGLRRLSDGEKVRSTEAIKQRIRRASKRGLSRLNAVDNHDLLLPSDQALATINRVLFEAVRVQTVMVGDRVKAAKPPTPDISSLTRRE